MDLTDHLARTDVMITKTVLSPFPAFILVFAFILVGGAGCTSQEVRPVPLSDHFDGARFSNRDGSDKGIGDVARFFWTSLWNTKAWPEFIDNPSPDPIEPRVFEGLKVTYVNHATVLIQTAGLNILTDPVWSERVSPVQFAGPKRIRAPGVTLSDLPDIDLILISHNHYDHLDLETLRKLRLQQESEPMILTGLGNTSLLKSIGYKNPRELDWGDKVEIGGSEIYFVECQHRSGRGVLDQMKTLWGSFVIRAPDASIYFAGDTGYSPHFKAQGDAYGPFDLSVLPIGAYEPRWFMKDIHLNPEEAVLAHQDLKSVQSMGIHFGVFQLTWEGVDEPVQDLKKARAEYGLDESAFWTLAPGKSRWVIASEATR